jgi:hypothetical protein
MVNIRDLMVSNLRAYAGRVLYLDDTAKELDEVMRDQCKRFARFCGTLLDEEGLDKAYRIFLEQEKFNDGKK